jgi:hypothetical protein
MAAPLLPDQNFSTNESAAGEQLTLPLSQKPVEKNNHFLRALGTGAALFIALLLLVFAVYFGKTLPGAWFPKSDVLQWGAADLQLVRGTLLVDRSDDERQTFQTDETGMAVIAINPQFSAAQYPVISFDVTPLPEDSAARLMWRSDFYPNERAMIDIDVVDGRLQPVTVVGHKAWISQISGLALVVQTSGKQIFSVATISAHPMGLRESLARLLRGWLAFSPWTGTSIAQLDDVNPPLAYFMAALLLVPMVIGTGVFFWRQRWRHVQTAVTIQWWYTGIVLLALCWLVVDARWSWQLTRQTMQTWQTYGGKDMTGKHRAALDAPLYAFIDKAKPILAERPSRVFALVPDPYLRSRIGYLLAPYNVYFDLHQSVPLNGRMLRRGDYVLAFQQTGIQYDAAKKMLRWADGTEIAAEIKLLEPGSALLEIL